MAENVRRFTNTQMLFHLGLVVTFMLPSVTGLAWMYIETDWGRMLAAPFGGYAGALEIHMIAGLVLLAGVGVDTKRKARFPLSFIFFGLVAVEDGGTSVCRGKRG
jgi:cytochrome b subunit of formate dehydrogenase